ncbi:MAG TPA: hypothetical protein VLT17_05315 [Gemmatimonadales bacterium]|nr:hypothetical protein [Gemmatimonadales bacterium]
MLFSSGACLTVSSLALGSVLAWASHTGPVPRYQAEQFECSNWIQQIRSDLRTDAARNERGQAGRDAVWSFRASAAGDSITLEGWFDSLVVWRETNGERQAPNTDGLVGGRYQGRLGPFGGFRLVSGPFIPDEIRPVADLSDAAADLFPLLPLSPISVGVTLADSGRPAITRLQDSVGQQGRIQRYRLSRTRKITSTRTMQDTLTVRVVEEETENGVWTWDPAAGLLGWNRQVEVDVTIPAQGPLRRAVHTRVDQRISLARAPGRSCP